MLFDTNLVRVALLLTLILTSARPQAQTQTQIQWPKDDLVAKIKHSESLSPAPLVDREVLMRNSRIFDIQMSPDGRYLSYQEYEGDEHKKRASIWLYDIVAQKRKRLFVFKHLKGLRWLANSETLLLETPKGIAVSNITGNPAPIMRVELDNHEREYYMGWSRGHIDSFLVRQWLVKDKEFVVYRVSSDGEKTELYRTATDFNDLEQDANGKPAFLRVRNTAPDAQGEQFIQDIRGDKPKTVWTCRWDDPCGLYLYDSNRQRLLLKTNAKRNFIGLAWLDLASSTLDWLHQDPLRRADLTSTWFESANKDNAAGDNRQYFPVLAQYKGDHNRHYALKDAYAESVDYLQHQFPGQSIDIALPEDQTSSSQPGLWLVTLSAAKVAYDRYFLFNPKQKQLTEPLAEVIAQANKAHPLMAEQYIAPMHPIHYQARDGFALQGYVVLPRGKKLNEAPLIAYPHGGPWSRDDDDFANTAQLLANRGYIVFMPNFRASTGFGKAYKQGTKQDFGDGTTQNDIIDGVHYLLDNGIGDREDLAIAGHSFGGFSTITGLTFTPKLFKVGFAGAPPTFIGRSAKYYYRFQKKTHRIDVRHDMKELVVDWDDPDAFAKAYEVSPDNHIEQLQRPLIMWAGKNDRRVFIVDVKDYALRAKEKNKPISLFVDPRALHSPNSRLGLQAYVYLLEKTMATYLGGPLQGLDAKEDKALIRFLKKHMVIDHNQLLSSQ